MSITYTLDPTAPDGSVRATDEESGASYLVYDPQKAKELNPPPPEDYSVPPIAPASVTTAAPTAPAPAYTPGAAASGAPVPTPSAAAPTGPYDGLPPAPVAPPGTVVTKAEITPAVPGVPFDENAARQRAEEAQRLEDELTRRKQDEQVVRNDQILELSRRKEADEAREAELAEKNRRYEDELLAATKRELNPNRLRERETLFGSILGLVGALAAGARQTMQGPNGTALQEYGNALDRRIQMDIDLQKSEKDSLINTLTKQLGSGQQAEAHFRASARGLFTDRLQAQLDNIGASNRYDDLILGLRAKTEEDLKRARQLSFAKPATSAYTFGQPTKYSRGVGGGSGAVAPVKIEASSQQYDTDDQEWANSFKAKKGINNSEGEKGWKAVGDYLADNSSLQENLRNADTLLYEPDKKNGRRLKGGKLPGYAAGMELPVWLASKEGVAAQQAILPVVAAYRKAMTGMGSSIPEDSRIIRTIIGDGSYASVKRGIDRLQREVDQKSHSLQSTYPGAWEGQHILYGRQKSRREEQDKRYKDQESAAERGKKPAAVPSTDLGVKKVLNPKDYSEFMGPDMDPTAVPEEVKKNPYNTPSTTGAIGESLFSLPATLAPLTPGGYWDESGNYHPARRFGRPFNFGRKK